jgi:hypothetical protein
MGLTPPTTATTDKAKLAYYLRARDRLDAWRDAERAKYGDAIVDGKEAAWVPAFRTFLAKYQARLDELNRDLHPLLEKHMAGKDEDEQADEYVTLQTAAAKDTKWDPSIDVKDLDARSARG